MFRAGVNCSAPSRSDLLHTGPRRENIGKGRVATIIDQLCEAGADLPAKVHANRALLTKQIARRQG